MKFNKVIILSIVLIMVAGADAAEWLNSLAGNTNAVPTQEQLAKGEWLDSFLGTQALAEPTAPSPLGLAAIGSVPTQANLAVDAIRQNIATMIAKVQEMAPAITTAITNKDFISIAKLSGPVKDILILGMNTAKNIQRALVANSELKGVFAGLVNQLNTALAPMAAQIRTMSETAGWGKSFILRTIALGLEQVLQLLNQAIR